MMIRKKNVWGMVFLIGVFIVSAMSVPVFAKTSVEITWIEWVTPEVGDEAVAPVLAKFEQENPDIKVRRISMPYSPVHDKIIALHAAGEVPDVLNMAMFWVAEFAEMNVIEPLDAYFVREGEGFTDQFVPGPLTPWKGKTYNLPFTAGSLGLFYNKRMFRESGIEGPPKTWEEFIEIAQKVTKPGKLQYAITAAMRTQPPVEPLTSVIPYIYQAGGELVQNGKAVFDSKEGVKALQLYVDLVNKYRVSSPGVLSNSQKEKRENFASENIAMMNDGPWAFGIMRQRNPGDWWGYTPLPRDVRTGTRLSGWNLSIAQGSEHKEEAWRLIKFLTGAEGNLMFCELSRQVPGNTNVASEAEFIQNDPYLKIGVEINADPGTRCPDITMPQGMNLLKIMTMEIQAAIAGEKTPSMSFHDAAEQWNEVLKKYY